MYNVGVFNETKRHLMVFVIEGIKSYINILKADKECERYAIKLEKKLDTFVDSGIKIYKPNKNNNGYNVLNHGDFHMKNMLFKHDENNKIIDVMFVSLEFGFTLK